MEMQYVKSKDCFKVTFHPGVNLVGDAKEVLVLGDFNGWDPEFAISLKKQKDGSFKGVLNLDCGNDYQFKYLIDGNEWALDSDAPEIPNGHGEMNSLVSTIK